MDRESGLPASRHAEPPAPGLPTGEVGHLPGDRGGALGRLLRFGAGFAGKLAVIAAVAACLWTFDWCLYHALDGGLMGLRSPDLPGFV